MYNFKKFFSLGNACKTRHQLDRIFGGRSANYIPVKGYFDWLWGAGINGVVKTIENDFEIKADSLVVKFAGGTVQVYDPNTGFYFLHDFVFSSVARENLDSARQEMFVQLQNFLLKYSNMAIKTTNIFASCKDVCFVYAGSLTRSQVIDFQEITRSKFHATPFLLNIVSPDAVPLPGETRGFEETWQVQVVDDHAVKGTPQEWMGVNESWDSAFQDFFLSE